MPEHLPASADPPQFREKPPSVDLDSYKKIWTSARAFFSTLWITFIGTTTLTTTWLPFCFTSMPFITATKSGSFWL